MSRPAGARAVLAVGIPVALATALAAFGALLAPGSVARAAGTPQGGPRKVLVVLVDRMTAPTIAPTSSGQQLDALGASALMTTATGRGADGDSPYAPVLSLSAGAPAVAPAGFHAAAASGGTPAFADMTALRAANAAAGVAAIPGLLGQTLEDHGIRTAAVGDSSLPGHPFTPAVALAMDEQGRVSTGALGTDEPQSVGPLPVRVDLAALEAATKQALASARFVVVDWGDTYRVDRIFQEHAGSLDEPGADGITLRSKLTAARTGALRRMDVYMRFVQSELDLKHSIVVMVSPSSPSSAAGGTGVNLAPIVAAGGGITHGALSSRTTRSNGFVSNEDLAPAVLTWFGVPVPSQMRGHAFTVGPADFGLTTAIENDHQLGRMLRQRTLVLSAAAVLWVIAVGLSLVLLERRLRRISPSGRIEVHRRDRGRAGGRRRRRRGLDDDLRWLETLARWALFAAAILPLVFLLQPLLSTGSTPVALLEVTGAALVLGCLLSLAARKRTANGLGAIGILTVLAIVGDAATGQWLAVRSMIGPSIVAGPTLHGLGPILGGAAVAAALLAAGALAHAARTTRWLRLAWIALTGFVLVLLSWPGLGGTTVAPAAGLVGLVTLAAAAERRPPGRRAWSAAGAALVIALVVLGAILLAADVSFARTAAVSDGSGLGAAGAAATLAGHAVLAWAGMLAAGVWTPLFASSVAVLLFVDGRLRRGPWAESARGRALQPADRHARATVAGMAAAAAVALVSGAAGAATGAVVLMGAAVLACAAAIERARPLPR